MEAFMGEIKLFGGTFAPVGWLNCDGSLLPIPQYDALYSLLGTTYGGDGQTTFGVPDLRGRVPIHRSPQMPMGQMGGEEEVTLTSDTIAGHDHSFTATTSLGDQVTIAGNVPAQSTTVQLYYETSPTTAMQKGAISATQGGGQPHQNMHPFQCATWIICYEGIYPPHS